MTRPLHDIKVISTHFKALSINVPELLLQHVQISAGHGEDLPTSTTEIDHVALCTFSFLVALVLLIQLGNTYPSTRTYQWSIAWDDLPQGI